MFGCSFAVNENLKLDPYTSGQEGDSNVAGKLVKNTEKMSGVVLGAIRIAGGGVAVVMLIVVAMKYMISAPGERAEIKKTSIQYVVGAAIIFIATNIVTILAEFFADLVK